MQKGNYLADCQLRKRFEWCGDIERKCSAILNAFDIDVEKSEVFCKLLSLELLPAYRYLRYIDNVVKLPDVSTDTLLAFRRCGLSNREIADLVNSYHSNVEQRLQVEARNVDEKAGLINSIVESGTANVMESLKSKWMQLHEMRNSTDEDIQLKSIKLQLEVEEAISSEKERILAMDKLVRFMAMMEDKVVHADASLREQVGLANKILSSEGRPQIPYMSIVREVRKAIETDKEFAEISNVLQDTTLSAERADD